MRGTRAPVLLAVLLVGALGAGMVPAAPAASASEIVIVRDRFGVPHVYGQTGPDVSYGAGYALAQDRLWQMHTFRLVAKGRLSHLLGPLVVAMDRNVRFWTYTADERAARFATYPTDIQDNVEAFVDGVNARIDEVNADPFKRPFEFQHFGEPIERWTVDDSLAMQDYLIFTFGSGGGSEIRNLALLQSLVEQFGETDGPKVFDDLVWVNDPDAPTSIDPGFDWLDSPTHARPEADDKTLESDARISLPLNERDGAAAAAVPSLAEVEDRLRNTPVTGQVLRDVDLLDEGRRMLERFITFGSNAQIVGPSRSATGNALQQAGPQVGYFLPQALTDFGLHAADGSLEATGMTFAGAGPAVLIGRGNGYAWTTTTGASDITDTFVVSLNPEDSRQYLFDDGSGPRWENMECRTETYSLKGVPFETQEVCRTRHGPVLAFDTDNGVAYALRYAWFNREGGTVEGFFNYNNAGSLEDFATATNLLASNHNMFYSDDQGNIGYWHPGNFPRRAPGDVRLPFVGTGSEEWEPTPLTAQEVPHAVNPPQGWLANWNNKPSVDWDRESGWGAVHGVRALQDNLDPALPRRPDPWGGEIDPDLKFSWHDLNANIRYAAFRDFNADFLQRFVPSSSTDPLEQAALDVLADYNGFVYDSNGDGFVDSAGLTILSRFVPTLREEVFGPHVSGDAFARTNTSTIVHVMDPDAALTPQFDWLEGRSHEDVAAAAFTRTVSALADQFGDDDPRTWRTLQPQQKYTRLNADLFADVARTQLGRAPGSDPWPGNVPNHIRMNRGTYNHLVEYLDSPSGSGVLGESGVKAGSVISPGQSGFIDPLGREDRHYRDQFDLYVQWRYKPMPMTLAESRALASSEVHLIR